MAEDLIKDIVSPEAIKQLEGLYSALKKNEELITDIVKKTSSLELGNINSLKDIKDALDKQGTLTYKLKNTSKTKPVISMKGQLSGLDMDQTISVGKPISGTNNASGLMVAGYKVVRDLDYDKTNQVLVAVQ